MRPPRLYSYGVIKRAILSVMRAYPVQSTEDIGELCLMKHGVDFETVRRNLAVLCTHRVLKNVGTRKAARYVIAERSSGFSSAH